MISREPVALEEMLEARERRVLRQQELLARYHVSLLYVTFNIPGPVKLPARIEEALQLALHRVSAALKTLDARIIHWEASACKTGCEACFAVDVDPVSLKWAMVALEEADSFGRLLDLDVLTPSGEKLARARPRRCLLCGKPAQVCGRSRAHRLNELTSRVEEILRETLQ